MKISLIAFAILINIMESGMVRSFQRLHPNIHVVNAGKILEGSMGLSAFEIGI